jgi:hypothetical protein
VELEHLGRRQHLQEGFLLLGEQRGLISAQLRHAIQELPGFGVAGRALRQQLLHTPGGGILRASQGSSSLVESAGHAAKLLEASLVQAQSLLDHALHVGAEALLELRSVTPAAASVRWILCRDG